jgi:recombination associated protein RdgC
MPIRRGSVSFARFKVEGDVPKDTRKWLSTALRASAFEALDPKGEDERTAGFVELENPGRTEFAVGDVFLGMHALFAWRVDKLRIPGNQVRAELLRWTQAFEQKNSRAPGRREKAEQKDTIRRALRSKTEPSTKTFEVSLDLAGRELFLWATSRAVVEEVQAALESRLSIKLITRVPAAFVPTAAILDALVPTPAFFGEVR